MRVGIVGYGNLGKAVEKLLKTEEDFELVKIFSKRDLPNCEKTENLNNYAGKIDLLFLCGGSQNELENMAIKCIENFSTIDAYDNHNRLKNYVNHMDELCKINRKVALCALGWDPGLFSYMRGLYSSFGLEYVTTWGKGVSQGHTQAIKNIDGVIDAIQFTIPNENAIENMKNGLECNAKDLHTRECFVVAKDENQADIYEKIIHMKDYFEGYHTTVNFVSQVELDALKTHAHRGEVFTKNEIINFSLNLPSNPEFTARVLISYAKSIIKLLQQKEYGAYTIFDLPLVNILNRDKFLYL